MLQNISQFFSNNPLLNIIFLLLALFSIVLTLIFYFKAKREKLPAYSKKTTRVIQNTVIKSNQLEVKYNGSLVENLSIMEFAFWNAGRETIRGSDIAVHDPLIIKSKNKIIIYDVQILIHDQVNNCQLVRLTENSFKMTFDFLDQNQGVKLKIYHSGNYSAEIEVLGTIIGTDGIKPGIAKNLLADKTDVLTKPINWLVNSKSIFLKVAGYIFALILSPFLVGLLVVILPMDYIYEKIHNTQPKEFFLHDDFNN